MFYAIVGIPLTLLTITNLGRMLATAFRFLYRNIFSIICCFCSSNNRPQQPETLPLHVTASTSGPDHGNSVYGCYVHDVIYGVLSISSGIKTKVAILHWSFGGMILSFSIAAQPVLVDTNIVCDAWPVRRPNYG